MQTTDVLVVGGGMSGVAVGAELAADRHVTVLDMEATLAHHTTGRSAAMFLESYGGSVIRALTTAGREALDTAGVLRPRPYLNLTLAGRDAAAERLHRDVQALVPDVELLTAADAVRLQPLLRPDAIGTCLLEPRAQEIDVHALHQSFLRRLRAAGGEVATSARVVAVERSASTWTVTCADGRSWQAPWVVDAAGAWADELAALFGAERVGLRPLRRSAFTVDAPADTRAPMFSDIDDAFYVKPDAGQLLISPAEETPSEPCDARPDELQIARAIEVVNTVTTLSVRSVRSSWAGLRSFVADRAPVVGPDPEVPGLFWYAAQGGYGIQTAPALARAGAALLRGRPLPADLVGRGLTAEALAPDRPALTGLTGNAAP